MPRQDSLPSTFSIRRPFEELALFSFSTPSQEKLKTGYLSGEFEVTVSYVDGDWHFSDLWISADNGRVGPEAKGELIHLDADVDERFFLMVAADDDGLAKGARVERADKFIKRRRQIGGDAAEVKEGVGHGSLLLRVMPQAGQCPARRVHLRSTHQ